MSVFTENAVWRGSQHKGGTLLLFLAIANQSNDAGISRQSKDTLAERCRMTPGWVKQVVRAITDSGEMAVVEGGLGRGDTNAYVILVGQPPDVAESARKLIDEYNRDKGQNFTPLGEPKGADSDAVRGDFLSRKGSLLSTLEHLLLKHQHLKPTRSEKKAPLDLTIQDPPAPAEAAAVNEPEWPASTREIQAEYERLLGERVTGWNKGESAAAKAIATRFTVAQFRAAYLRRKAERFWQTRRLRLRQLVDDIPDLLRANSGEIRGADQGHPPAPQLRRIEPTAERLAADRAVVAQRRARSADSG